MFEWMKVVVGMHAAQCCMSGDAGAPSECKVKADDTAFQVRSSGYGRLSICLSSREGLSTGCCEKALVLCPSSRLAVFYGAPWTHSICARVKRVTNILKTFCFQ